MNTAELLVELFGRVPPLAHAAVEGLDTDALLAQVAPQANSIAWLLWHLTRVQDDHLAEILGIEQLWVTGGWAEGFGLDPDPVNTGYRHTPDQVAAVRPRDAAALTDYLDAVQQRAIEFLSALRDADLDRIVDRNWDPPVTLGVRLVSVADDSLQHVGQASFVRGILDPASAAGRP
jgi:uncharacterized damage-inducible protein DinB